MREFNNVFGIEEVVIMKNAFHRKALLCVLALILTFATSASAASDGIQKSWGKLTSTLTEALDLRDKHEVLPKSAYFGADKSSNAKKINALLAQCVEILLQGEAVDLRKQAIDLRVEIPALQLKLYDLRNKAVSAPESSWLPWVKTHAAMEENIAKLEKEIQEKEKKLADANGKAALALREMGIDLDDRQIDILLTSVTGDDLFQNSVIFANVKHVVEKLAELSREDRGNLEIARRYAGMYLVLNDLLIVTQEELVKKVDAEYKPRLSTVRDEAEKLRKEALERAAQPQYTEGQKNTFRVNAEANAMTIRVAGLYAELLENQRKSVMTTLANLHRNRDVAENTYKTIRSTGDLRSLIQSGLELFDSIQSLTMPQIQTLEYEAIRKEFEEINKRLKK